MGRRDCWMSQYNQQHFWGIAQRLLYLPFLSSAITYEQTHECALSLQTTPSPPMTLQFAAFIIFAVRLTGLSTHQTRGQCIELCVDLRPWTFWLVPHTESPVRSFAQDTAVELWSTDLDLLLYKDMQHLSHNCKMQVKVMKPLCSYKIAQRAQIRLFDDNFSKFVFILSNTSWTIRFLWLMPSLSLLHLAM